MPKSFVPRPGRAGRRQEARAQGRRQPARRWFGFALACLAVIGLSVFWLEWRLAPMVRTASASLAARVATEALNEAMGEVLSSYPDGEDLVSIRMERGANGQAFSIVTLDMAKLAKLQSEAIHASETRLQTLRRQTLTLPVLQALSGSILAGYTATVPVSFSLVGAVHARLDADVASKGVNQVVHIVYLELTADVMTMTPLVRSPVHVTARSPVVYIIMSGPVPNVVFPGGTGATS
ncbi:sporulation protein YunB [Alicyclobacillus acidocaldarius]|uniref:sporulation protein YunB n=1 Tax=Alicyclobacillus acidocaldarius TaxID=405212 RepID=UPI00345E1114